MDPALIMDDIVEKLNLLDYINRFCKPNKLKPLSRTYFAYPEKGGSQVKTMY